MNTMSRIRMDRTGLAAAFALGLAWSPCFAQVDIAPAPIAQASTAVVKPNLMFVLDDSGSMGSDFMPDSVRDSYCKDADNTLQDCRFGMPAYNAALFNTMYYDPAITYTPPTKYDV